MKVATPTLAVALVLGLGSPAAALHFTPKRAAIEAKGAMSLTWRRSLSCAVDLGLSTAGKDASATSASFAGHQCATIQPTGLPWRVSIEEGGFNGFHPLMIHGFALRFVHGETCGPTDIKAMLNPHGLIKFSKVAFRGTTPCSIDASVSTSPRLGVKARAR